MEEEKEHRDMRSNGQWRKGSRKHKQIISKW